MSFLDDLKKFDDIMSKPMLLCSIRRKYHADELSDVRMRRLNCESVDDDTTNSLTNIDHKLLELDNKLKQLEHLQKLLSDKKKRMLPLPLETSRNRSQTIIDADYKLL